MKKRLVIAAGLITAAGLSLPSASQAQVGAGMYAPPDAMDSLSGQSVGGAAGGGGFDPVGRARNAAGAAGAQGNPFAAPQGNPFGAGAGAGAGNPFDGGGANPFGGGGAGDPFGGGNPFGGPQGNQFANQVSQYIPPATLTAWGGERIIDVRTGQIMQDARELSILATATGNYFDDGQNGGDAVAGDNIWTNVTINDTDFISPEAHFVKTKMIQTLQFVSPPTNAIEEQESVEEGLFTDLQGISTRSSIDLRQYLFAPREAQTLDFFSSLTPMQFSQVRVATTEPLSSFPQMMELEEFQDKFLRDWGNLYLREYRVDPDKFDSEFIPTYLPPPPRVPNTPLPENFLPYEPPEDSEEGQGGVGPGGNPFGGGKGGDLFGGDASGEPIGNASSRYF